MTNARLSRHILRSLLLLGFGSGASSPLSAQELFQFPAQPIQYDQYSAVWECVAAVHRVRDSVSRFDPVWRDTLPWVEGEQRKQFPEVALQVARQCGKRSMGDHEQSYLPWLELMLLRGDSAEAESLIQKNVIETTYATPREAMDVMSLVLDVYRDNPDRSLLSMTTITKFIERHTRTPEQQAAVWGEYLRKVAKARYDQSLQERIGEKIVSLIGKFGGGENDDGTWLRYAVFEGVRARYERELIDTLRLAGTAAFKRFWHAMYAESEKKGWLFMMQWASGGVSEQAFDIHPAMWYPASPREAIPTPGQISLLIFIDSRSHTSTNATNNEPFELFATIRRLKERFPALDVTVVSRTLGWVGHGPAVTVKAEGETLRQWLLGERQLPVRLAIDSTPWYRLPEPDRRRVNMGSDIDKKYYLGVAGQRHDVLKEGRGHAVLVSQDGMIVRAEVLGRQNEQNFAATIEALMFSPTSR